MGKENKTGVTEKMEKLLFQLFQANVNDAVKLAFLSGEDKDQIDKMDLRALTGFKRAGNGAVEVTFVDRMAIIEKLVELHREDPTEALLRQMGGAADE